MEDRRPGARVYTMTGAQPNDDSYWLPYPGHKIAEWAPGGLPTGQP